MFTLSKLYLAISFCVVALYAATAYFGWEYGTAQKRVLPNEARQSPSSIRSFNYWHDGYQGGK